MALLLLNAGVVVLGTSSMASINLLINNVAPPESLGSVNGMAASLTAVSSSLQELRNALPTCIKFDPICFVLVNATRCSSGWRAVMGVLNTKV